MFATSKLPILAASNRTFCQCTPDCTSSCTRYYQVWIWGRQLLDPGHERCPPLSFLYCGGSIGDVPNNLVVVRGWLGHPRTTMKLSGTSMMVLSSSTCGHWQRYTRLW